MNGLTVCIDANNPKSYSGSGNTWIDLINKNANFNLANTPPYTPANTTNGAPAYFSFSNVDVTGANTLTYATTGNTIWRGTGLDYNLNIGKIGSTNCTIEIVWRLTAYPAPGGTFYMIDATTAGDGLQLVFSNTGTTYQYGNWRWANGGGIINYYSNSNPTALVPLGVWRHDILSYSLENGSTWRINGGNNNLSNKVLDRGTVVSATGGNSGVANTITLPANFSSANTDYVNDYVSILTGTGYGDVIQITAYDGVAKIATVSRNWKYGTPDTTSTFQICVPGTSVNVGRNNSRFAAIGTQAVARYQDQFIGDIALVRMWNRELTDFEAKTSYNILNKKFNFGSNVTF